MSKNISELSGRQGLENNLFDKLGEAAVAEGTPSKVSLDQLADEFLLGKANTYGTATFYDFLKPENKGKKAYVCNGSACVCAGTQDKVKEELEKHFDASEIGHMTCLGRCYENSSFNYNGANYSGGDIDKFEEIKAQGTPARKYNVKATKEVLTAPYDGFDVHYELLKTALNKASRTAIE